MPSPFAKLIQEHTGIIGITSDPIPNKDAELVQEMERDLEERLTQKSSLYTPDNIHASQIYKECPRKWWLLKQAGKQHESMPVGCGLAVCFDIGHALHKLVQEKYFILGGGKYTIQGRWDCVHCGRIDGLEDNKFRGYPPKPCGSCFVDMYRFVEPHMKLTSFGKHRLVGSCDGVIAVDGNPWAILEIKTANDWSYNQDPESWSWWPGYLWQAHAYMKGFGLDKTVFMIINKAKQSGNELPIKFKLVNFDNAIWKVVSARATLLNEIQEGDWDGHKTVDLQKTCRAGSIDKNCPVAVECFKDIV